MAPGFGRLFERRLIDLGMPASPAPIVWFAGVGLVAAALGAGSLYSIEGRIDGGGVAKAAYVAASGIGVTGLVMFAHAPNSQSAVAAALLIRGVGLPHRSSR